MFNACSSLTSVTIPNSVKSIGHEAFRGCTSLTSITLNWTDSESILPFNTDWGLPTVPSYYTYPEGLESLYYEKGWPSQFTLECVINNGTVEITPSLTTYPYGTDVTLTVTPNDGQEFLGWNDMNMENPRTITITGNTTLEGYCTSYIYHTITIGEVQNGNLSVDYTTAKVGDIITITPTAEYGYENPNIEVTTENGEVIEVIVSKLGDYSFTMPDDNVTITGYFRPITIDVTLTANNCTITSEIGTLQDSTGTYGADYQSEITLVVTPNDGYTFKQWSDGNTDNPRTIVVTQNIVLTSVCESSSILDTQIYYNATEDLSTSVGRTLGSVNLVADSCTYDSTTGDGVLTYDGDVTEITNNYFYSKTQLVTISLPDSVTNIGNNAFRSCSSLTSITIGNSVTSIGNYAFERCTSLTSVIIPNSVTNIGEGLFSSCSSLTSITIPNSVTSIGNTSFSSCSSLTSITIPNSVTSIGNYAFGNCTSLTSVIIPNSVTYIGNQCFSNCPLTSINLPDSLKEFGDSVAVSYPTFCNSQFEEITIPKNVEIIHDQSAPIKNNDKLKKIIWNVSSSVSVFNSSNRMTLSDYDCTNVTELEFGENVVFIPQLIRVSKSITKITCKSLVAPTTESSAIRTMAATNGELHVKTGSDYSSLLSELGSGWTIVYDVE